MKMYRVLRNLALFICAAVACSSLLAVSCEDPGNDPVPETKYTLSVSPSGSVSFSAEGSSMNFKVTTNADSDRCLFPSNDWLSVEFDSAANAYAVTVAPNTTGNERSFELKFCGYKSGSDKEVVSAVVKAVQPSVKKEDLSVSADPAALKEARFLRPSRWGPRCSKESGPSEARR